MTDTDVIGVGIIGATPERGWAATTHIPALRTLPEYQLRAVATSRRESADAAGLAFGVPSYDDYRGLIARDDVDLVVVSVKVPMHRELVSAALTASKSVFCEWPLGASLDEARELAELSRAQGARTMIGLQGRTSPAINYVRDLVADGYVGQVLSTTMVVSAMVGDGIDIANAYLVDRANAANLLTVTLGHNADIVAYCLGEFEQLAAQLDVRRPTVTVNQTGEVIARTSPDQAAIIARLHGGATAALHFRGGLGNGAEFDWQINGTEGDLRVTVEGGSPPVAASVVRGGKSGHGLDELPVPSSYSDGRVAGPAGVQNVAALYAQFAADRRDATQTAPTFDTAVTRHRLVAAIEESARTGVRQTLG